MSVRTDDFGFDLRRRVLDFTREDLPNVKLSEEDKEKLRTLLTGSILSAQQLVTSLDFIGKLSLDETALIPDSKGNLTVEDIKLTVTELNNLLLDINKKIKTEEANNSGVLLMAKQNDISEEDILPETALPKSSPPGYSVKLTKAKEITPVAEHDWSELDLGITKGSMNVLWISQQIAVILIESNTRAAKIAADAANLLNRILSELSAVSQFLTTLSSIYTEALNVKQTNQIKDEKNQGITSSTISFDELIENNLPPNSGDETTELTFATYTDKDGNVRQGFLMTDVPDIMKSLMGLNGGSFNYLDWNGYYIQNKDGNWVKDGTVVNESVKKVTEKKGYIFVDSVTINSLMLYTSQLLALAVPSNGGNLKGDFYDSYSDAPKNNITIQGAIDAIANKVKQVQSLLSSVTQQVSIYQGNSQSATTPFNTVLAMINQILGMLGA